MKTCLICNAVLPDSTVSCPHDGEASWGWSKDAQASHSAESVRKDARPQPQLQIKKQPR